MNTLPLEKLDKRKHRFLNTEIRRVHLGANALRVQGLANHAARRNFGQLNAGGFGDKRHGAAGARIDLQHKNDVLTVLLLDSELHIHQAHHIQTLSHGRSLAFELIHRILLQVIRR